jgi:hypothetical protein
MTRIDRCILLGLCALSTSVALRFAADVPRIARRLSPAAPIEGLRSLVGEDRSGQRLSLDTDATYVLVPTAGAELGGLKGWRSATAVAGRVATLVVVCRDEACRRSTRVLPDGVVAMARAEWRTQRVIGRDASRLAVLSKGRVMQWLDRSVLTGAETMP